MTRLAVVKAVAACAAVFGLTAVVADCSHRNAPSNTGSVQLALKLSSTTSIDSVDYLISGNGIVPITASIDVSKFNTASALVSGIPAAKGYSVELDATSTNGAVSCAGTTNVDVVEGNTTQANIVLQCSDSRGTGAVTITGSFDNCPVVTSYMATRLSAPLNGVVTLTAKGADLDGDPLVDLAVSPPRTFVWTQTPTVGALGTVTTPDSRSANTTFTCNTMGTTMLSVAISDGTCGDKATISVSCGLAGTGGTSGGGTGGTSGTGTGGTSGTGGSTGGGGGTATGGMTGTGGTAGAGGTSSTGGTTGSGGAVGTGGAGGGACTPTHCAGAACDACSLGSTGACDPPTNNGCDDITDAGDRQLCEDAYACFVSPVTNCLRPGGAGDALACWCGTNPTTCVTSNSPPTQANGPCLAQVFAAAKSMDAPTINARFVDAAYPLGHAAILLQCRASFCAVECSVVP